MDKFDIALIDADYLIYHAAWASREYPQMGATTLRKQIYTLLEKLEPNVTWAALYATSKEPPERGFRSRDEVYTIRKYKGNRKDDPAILTAKEELRVALMEWCVSIPGYEADDLINTAVQQAGESSTVIVSHDKDLRQIPGWHHDPTRKGFFYVTEEAARYNYWMRVLMGDTTDNIQGVPGCGPRTAEKLMKDCRTDEDYMNTARGHYTAILGRDKGIEQFDMTAFTVMLWTAPYNMVEKMKPVKYLMNEL